MLKKTNIQKRSLAVDDKRRNNSLTFFVYRPKTVGPGTIQSPDGKPITFEVVANGTLVFSDASGTAFLALSPSQWLTVGGSGTPVPV